MDQRELDERIRDYYEEQFDEAARLTTRSAQGPLEHQRIQELIAEHLAEGRVIDVGGGAGVHARSLLDRGHRVTLVDPVRGHVRSAAERGVDARVGDARSLPFAADSFDAALLLGPLYHLADRADRLQALGEAARVVRSGGWVFAAGLSRFIGFGQLALGVTDLHLDDEHGALLEHGAPSSRGRFPAGHFHTAESLAEEAVAAGLDVLEVHGVEGPGGLLLEGMPAEETALTQAALLLARAGSTVPGIRELSPHLLAVCRVR
ncbi:bifunctional 2-polyprenyl-6-hydroxyphenol methylase/3-demethylubiquinol 3-O-methyltransferase UbiG [Microbacterium sp. LCT-H2]|uniref:class I SAM-dependent methyltransferase n=1 Tax=Microbacterium sp. LCT-H2 TaxID=1914306 RepID=UPI0008F55224|nr:class I SAM-dependent methyltransferase [Microbacterium sp. LCT-H2]OIJ32405.1 hypothetical protein BK819_11620 [Microbacterium sp. LCT-H2]